MKNSSSQLDMSRPDKITGGCLCGAIRYEISFPDDTSWPADSCTCQCSMCRKWTGGLISYDLLLKPTQVTPDLSTLPTYTQYQSSENASRGFCSKCGSGLTWKVNAMPVLLVIMLGSIDEEYLLGKQIAGSEKETETGIKFERQGGLAKDLCNLKMGHLFWNNIIPGITDHDVGGTKFMQSFPQD